MITGTFRRKCRGRDEWNAGGPGPAGRLQQEEMDAPTLPVRGQRRPSAVPAAVMVLVLALLTGVTVARNSDWRDPLRLWQNTALRSPGRARVHYNLARQYEAAGDTGRAAEQYRTAIALRPGYAEAHNNLGNLYAGRGAFQDAAAEFRRVIEIRPEAALPHDNLGYVYLRMGMLEEAVAEYRRAAALAPDRPEIRNNLGYALLLKGGADEAVREFEAAIAMDPGLQTARENLAAARRAQRGGGIRLR